MIKVENIEVHNLTRAIYSARNAMCSWDKSDSDLEKGIVGEKDLELARRLYRGGTEHRKFARQIFVSMDIVAPDYFFKEFSTYKVGVTENSTSTMHRIAARKITLDDFSTEHLSGLSEIILKELVQELNGYRANYIATKDKRYWWQIIQLLPMSYNYRRTVTMSYENVFSMIKQRKGHKLDEWNEFVAVLEDLPCVREIIGEKPNKDLLKATLCEYAPIEALADYVRKTDEQDT